MFVAGIHFSMSLQCAHSLFGFPQAAAAVCTYIHTLLLVETNIYRRLYACLFVCVYVVFYSHSFRKQMCAVNNIGTNFVFYVNFFFLYLSI